MDQFVSCLLLSAQFADIGIKFASALHEPVFEVEGFAGALVLLEIGGLCENLAIVINAAPQCLRILPMRRWRHASLAVR